MVIIFSLTTYSIIIYHIIKDTPLNVEIISFDYKYIIIFYTHFNVLLTIIQEDAFIKRSVNAIN